MALCPPKYSTDEGSQYLANQTQQWLWDCWKKAWVWVRDLADGDPWVFVLNGDAIEGRHHSTIQLVSHDVMVHLHMARDVLAPVVRDAQKIYLVRGTECHARTVETTLGDMLDAERDPSTDSPCFEQLALNINGTLCSFRHHIGCSTKEWTRGNALSGAMLSEQTRAASRGHPVPRVVVRSHRHTFDAYRSSRGLIVTTPPWQALTRYGRMVTEDSMAEVGLIALDFRNKPKGELPDLMSFTRITAPDKIITL